MKTSIFTLAMVFIFTVQSVFSQDVHMMMESTFSNFKLHQVVETLKAEKRYSNEPLVVNLVDSSYMEFQDQIREMIVSGQFDAMQVEFMKTSFIQTLQTTIELTPKNPQPSGQPKMFNGPCVNMDFEEGTLNGWDLWRGTRTDAQLYDFSAPVPMGGPSAHHTVFGGGIDPVVGIPRVNPDGGSFSVRLGNGTTTGAGAARMSQSFLVDATNYFFTYSYAVVFENPNGHTANERPYFTVRVYDEFGGNIACGEYSVYADPANASDFQAIGSVLYKDWTTVFTNLSAYIGQNVTIEFTTGDCSLGGHYGYAYLDASCAIQQITASDYDICPGQTSTLTAPAGIGSYLWSTGEVTQSIIVSSGGTYSCQLTPLQGPACGVTLDVTIIEFPEPTADFTILTNVVCLEEPIEFVDNSTISAPGNISTYQWNFGNGVNTPASNGAIVAVPNTTGTYTNPIHDYATNGNFNVTLTIVSVDGCTDNHTLPVTINPLPAVVAGIDQTVCEGTQVTLNGAGAVTYSWDNGVTDGIAFTPMVGTTIYTVTGTDPNGCENTDQVQVTVNPLPNVDAGLDQTICSGDQVTLNGAGASAYSWDNGVTDGIAFTPAVGLAFYTVTGTDVNGCEGTDAVSVLVHSLPDVNAGLDQTICAGEEVTLEGAGATTYSWDNGVTNGIAFTPAVGSIIYTITGTDANGCEDQDQVSVTVNPLPIVNAGIDQTVCSGTQITLGGVGANTYSWDNGVIDNLAFTPAVGTMNYTVTGTDLNGCENTDQVQVTVNPLPNVNAGSDQTICLGDQVTLNGSGANTYSWDNGVTDGNAFTPAVGWVFYTVTGTDLNGCENSDVVSVLVHSLPNIDAGPDLTVCDEILTILNGSGAAAYSWDNGVVDGQPFQAPVGNTNYTVTGTDVNGCVNTDQVTITVHALPIVYAGLDQTVCENTPITLTGTGAIIYDWDHGVINGTPFTQVVGQQTYTLTGTDINGCEDTDQLVVTVNPNPNVHAGNDITICEGESVILTGFGATNYIWSNGVVNGVAFFPSQGTYVYHVIGLLATGCSAADSLLLTVHPKPNVWAADVNVCRGSEAVLKANGADAYLWSHGIIDNVPFTPTQSDTYVVTGWNIFGCSDTASAKVMVHEIPEASFYPRDYEITVLNPSTQFINTSVGATNYTWTFGDGSDESYEFSPFHEFPAEEPGIYEIQLVASNPFGCVDTAVRFIEIKDELIIYVPNTFTPDGDDHNNSFKPVLTDGFDPQGYTLYIFNRWGQIVFESHDTAYGWNGFYGLGGDLAQDGTYTWKIEVKEEHTTKMHVFVGHVNLIR